MKWAEPEGEDEKRAQDRFEKLVEKGRASANDDGGFTVYLLRPISAFPENKDSGGGRAMLDKLTYRPLTTGDLMAIENEPTNRATALKLIARLSGLKEKVLEQLYPKDFEVAEEVALYPFAGPSLLPTGKSS